MMNEFTYEDLDQILYSFCNKAERGNEFCQWIEVGDTLAHLYLQITYDGFVRDRSYDMIMVSAYNTIEYLYEAWLKD